MSIYRLVSRTSLSLGANVSVGAKALCLVASIGLVVFAACIRINNGVPSADAVRRQIEAALEPGASVEEIQEYLDTQGAEAGIEHIGETTRATYYSQLREEAGITPDTPIYVASIRGDLRGVDIYFILDDSLLLQRVITFDAYTGF